MRTTLLSLMVFSALLGGCSREPQSESIHMTNGQGEIAGEVTAESVILHSRLTTEAVMVDGDVPGVPGGEPCRSPAVAVGGVAA